MLMFFFEFIKILYYILNDMSLWKTLIDKNMKKIDLQNEIKCSSSTITTMGRNEFVSMDILNRICLALNCKIEEVIEFRKED